MQDKYIFILYWITILILFENTALYFIKKESLKHKSNYIKYACLIYGLIIPFILLKLLKYEGIGLVNFFWNILSTISGILIGIYLFNEKINNKQIIGIIISLTGLYLILLDSENK